MEPPTVGEDVLHEGYATTADYPKGADYEWVCATCFDDFSIVMGWFGVANSN